MSRRKARGTMAIGTPSAVLVFVVLCLTCFGALAFSTANADLRLTEQTARSVSDYYAADARAQRALMKLDEALAAMPAITAAELAKTISPLADTAAEGGDGAAIRMTFSFGRYQALAVTVKLAPGGEPRYQIAEYSTILIREPIYDDTLNIWKGGA